MRQNWGMGHMFQYGEYIYAVYRERSFSKAAEKLFITQPALSITIRKAEDELGLPLFNRRTTPISLTPFGAEYIQALEQIRLFELRLKRCVDSERTLQSGHLAVASSNLGMDYVVTQWLAEFHRRCPQILLTVRSLNTLQVKHLLDSGDVDFVITNRPYGDDRYEQKPCYRETLILAVPASFEVNDSLRSRRLKREDLRRLPALPPSRSVSLKRFADVPFIVLSNQNYLRQCTDRLFAESGISPPLALELQESASSLNFAALGVGAAILSSRLAERGGDFERLCFYRIAGRGTERDAYLTCRRNAYRTAAMKVFEELILSWDDPDDRRGGA